MPHRSWPRALSRLALALAALALAGGQLYPPGPTAPLSPPGLTRPA